MLRYAITDRSLLAGDEAKQKDALIRLAAEWAHAGVDYIQIREKDLEAAALFQLVTATVQAVQSAGGRTRVLLNGPARMALEAGCDGLHLPGSATPGAAEEAHRLFQAAGKEPVISVACHGIDEVGSIPSATLLVFAPVFEKPLPAGQALPGAGLDALRHVCRAAIVPVLALGGVTWQNAGACMAAGAAGIAGIRLFLDGDGQWSPSIRPQGHEDLKSR